MKRKNKTITEKFLLLVEAFVLVILILQFISASEEEYKPYLHKSTVGETPELNIYGQYETALFLGAGIYNYKIEVPKGTNELQPLLIINYNSQSVTKRPGIVGAGWSITENYIKRNVNYTIDDSSDDYFIFMLNGNINKIFYNGTNFNTKIKFHLLIQNLSYDGRQYWMITDESGNKYRFGYDNDSVLYSNTGKSYLMKWNLDQIEDTNGNKVYYNYLENPNEWDNGSVYLSNISYNNEKLRVIRFDYENLIRPDVRLVYGQGNSLVESRRLENISVYFNESLIRRYELRYKDLNEEKSLTTLSNITYIGSDNSSVLNSVDFEYYPVQKGFDNSTGMWIMPEAFSGTGAGNQDYGIRLIDVNNDGFVDIIKSKNGEEKYTKLNNKSGGWDDSSFFSDLNEDIVDGSKKDMGIRFADINRDGLIDFIKSKSGTNKVYLNNGTGWIDSTSNWEIPTDFIDSANKDLGVRFADINGDGKVDIIQSKESGINNRWLNNGSGWVSTSYWNIPYYFVKNDDKDSGLRLIDFNNDGLIDLIKGGEPGSAWINNGSGWMNHSQYAPNLNFTGGDNEPDLGVRFMDINGDKLVDILQNFYSNVSIILVNETCVNETNETNPECNYTGYNETNLTNAKLNNGSGWIYNSDWLSPERFTHNGYNMGRRIADVNGDGYSDIIVSYLNVSLEKITHIRNATNSYVLKVIENEFGGVTNLGYGKSTLSNNSNNMGFNMWIISNVTNNNSLSGNFNVLSEFEYIYWGGMFNYSESEFRGFNIVNETLPDNSIIAHYFHQDNILNGREYKTEIFDDENKLFRSEKSSYSYSFDNEIFLNSSSIYIYDGELSPLISNISYEYDIYGNINKINNFGNINFLGDEKYEEFYYFYNVTANIINKLQNYSVYSSDGSTVVRRNWYFYDNLVSGVNTGDLTKIEYYYDNGDNPEIQYVYGNNGNVIREIDALGNSINYTFDTETNTFIIKQTNALGHHTYFEYNKGTGNLISERRDGLIKNYTYDVFGRIKKKIYIPDTEDFPTMNFSYDIDGLAPEKIKVMIKNNDSDYSENLYIYDGFSNLVQIKNFYDENTQIVRSYYYDGKFRIHKEQIPYFSSYSENLDTASFALMIYGYDALDRVISLTKPNNSTILTEFNKSKITSYNENNNKKEYIVNSHDRIINVHEFNFNSSSDEELYNTSYSYNTIDQITKIEDSEHNNFTFGYDLLGRKISIEDPNMENWTYIYDLNGNIVNQTDGRNITVQMEYDRLNRIEVKYSNNSNVSFFYDTQYNGTLANMISDGDYFNIIRYNYTYDDRLRVVLEELYICYREIDPGEDECGWINFSVDYDSSDKVLEMHLPQFNLSYEYNKLGNLKRSEDFLESINYNAFGGVINKTYANNLVTEINYDDMNRISNLQTGEIQNLSYSYDNVSNVKIINDTKNSKAYSMVYDSLNRLTTARIFDYLTYDHEKFVYAYNAIGNLLNFTSDEAGINYTYNSSRAHAPAGINKFNRIDPRIDIDIMFPNSSLEVNQNEFFNFTVQTCCRDDDCWGINVTLDPEKHSFTKDSETICTGGKCTTTIYSGTKFVFEDEEWKKIEDARSLKNVMNLDIELDPNFPAEVIDYNYTTITLNLSISSFWKIITGVPLKVYDRYNSTKKPRDIEGNLKNKDRNVRFLSVNENKIVTIDLSDTRESILGQEIKYGDHSTIITISDTSSENTDDTYVYENIDTVYGEDDFMYIRNYTDLTKNILIRFNTLNIPKYALIDNAELFLYVDGNDLFGSDSYNVSVHKIYNSFNWNESTTKWSNRPSESDYNLTYLDKIKFSDGDENSYFSWNVTPAIKEKNDNESFYIIAIENDGGDDNDDLKIVSKDHDSSNKPYLNVTYRLKGIIPENVSETPFYTNVSNPYYVDLEEDECQNVTWWVNATGDEGDYIFFAFANKTSDMSVGNITSNIDVSIMLPPLIGLNLLYPISDISVTQNQSFNVIVNVTCLQGNCGTINASLDPIPEVNEELIEKRTYNQKAFSLDDGKIRYKIHAGHIHYKDNGGLADIDTTLVETDSGWTMNKASYSVEIPKYSDDSFEFTNNYEDNQGDVVSMKPVVVNNVEGVLDSDNSVVYADSFGTGIDLKVRAGNNGFDKLIIINEKPVDLSKDLEFRYEIEIDGFDVSSENGLWNKADSVQTSDSIVLDKTGETFFREFRAWDSSGKSFKINVKLENIDDKYYLIKILDKEFLENAVYPVFTDDTVSYYAGSGDGYVYNDGSDWDTVHDASSGSSYDYTSITSGTMDYYFENFYYIYRSFVPIDTSGIDDSSVITSASLYLYGENIYTDLYPCDVHLVQTTQSSSSSLYYYDFDQVGNTDGTPAVDMGYLYTSYYNQFDLNSIGKAWIDKSGTTYFGLRTYYDFNDIDPDDGYQSGYCWFDYKTSEESGTDEDPYLEVDSYIAGKGIIPFTIGETPFYTNNTNPRTTASLNSGQSEVITYWVNATGSLNTYEFFAYVNLTSDLSIGNKSSTWFVDII
ncbi:DNRLRE domain-containing protein [Candidatus Pacearchaeota archaeon]|nr:DNRLRE domain-containing protein [Candidatus Pacearchaeota archaeon]